MKVDHVEHCTCCDHEKDAGDSVYYGMPILTPTDVNYLPNGKITQFWEVKCPVCGIGGIFPYKSPYLALKAWNEIIKEKREILNGKIFY